MHRVGPGSVVIDLPDRDVDAVLRFGTWEALLRGAPVELLHVLRPGEEQRAAEALLENAVTTAELLAGPGVPVGGRLLAESSVAEAVDAVPDALLVVGSEKETQARLRAVTQHGSARPIPPLACVPPDWHLTPEDDRPVLVGVDDLSRSRALVTQALELAHLRETGVEVLHTWRLPRRYRDLIDPRIGEQWARAARHELEVVVARCVRPSAQPRVPVEVRVERGRPAAVLADAVRHAQLLVLEQTAPAARPGRRPSGCPCPTILLPGPAADRSTAAGPGVSAHPDGAGG